MIMFLCFLSFFNLFVSFFWVLVCKLLFVTLYFFNVFVFLSLFFLLMQFGIYIYIYICSHLRSLELAYNTCTDYGLWFA